MSEVIAQPNLQRQPEAVAGSILQSRRWRARLVKLFSHLILIAGGVTMVFPFLWMVSTSLKPLELAFVTPPVWIPNPIRWQNYSEAWGYLPFGLFYLNSIKIAVLVMCGHLLTCSMGGYAFARLRFPGRDWLFLGYLGTMMIPGQVTLIPNFILMRHLGWIDTHTAIIVPALFSAFGTFLMRQFFLTIPQELTDAGSIDGANPLAVFAHIMLPLTKPALATLAVFTFMGNWNSLLWPLIVLDTMEKRTLPLGLVSFRGYYMTSWNLLMAATVMSLAPVIALFLAAQRYFTQGITLTGLTGQ